MPAQTLDQLLAGARRRLQGAPFKAPRREAALLLGHVLGLREAQVMARGEQSVGDEAAARFDDLVERRLAGEPVAYLLGEREFYGRAFTVDARVLIPRPETEHLVDEALTLARAGRLPNRPRVLDLGTGSGCLAVTLALELEASAVATDLSPGALAVAAANLGQHRLAGRVALVAADLAAGLELSRFDLVVSNPPYIEASEVPALSREILDFEPPAALFPPGGGAAFFERYFGELEGLRPGTPVLTEIGHRQGPVVAALLQGSFFELVAIRPDYAGRDRVVIARRR